MPDVTSDDAYPKKFKVYMPYRRLPNTNQARLRALSRVVETGTRDDEAYCLAVPYTLLEQARMMLPQYERKMSEYHQCFATQVANSKACMAEARQARMYVSHFIQVLNMCVQRGEINARLKQLYGLTPDNYAVPDIASDDKLFVWGKRVIDGEQKRQSQGGIPIYNPPIAKVMVYYDLFADKYNGLQVLQQSTVRTLRAVTELNAEVDSLLLQIWNEVEHHFSDLPPCERMDKCCEYGVVYYTRRTETEKVKEE